MGRIKKGFYNIKNREKYLGNPLHIIYRSGWEKDVMIYLDTSSGIKKWASEEIIIPYYSPVDKRVHDYYPDFYIETSKGKKKVIEIKPSRQTKPPKKGKRYLSESKTWIINQAKWEAAKKYCQNKNFEFVILTEDNVPKWKLAKKSTYKKRNGRKKNISRST